MTEQIIISSGIIIAVTIVALIGLKAWQDWIALKSRELDRTGNGIGEIDGGASYGTARIEIADLKERIRQLEAIARGVDL
ncbi:MAG: hypothetical protein WA908_02315 [Pontixanthobacter sp.]